MDADGLADECILCLRLPFTEIGPRMATKKLSSRVRPDHEVKSGERRAWSQFRISSDQHTCDHHDGYPARLTDRTQRHKQGNGRELGKLTDRPTDQTTVDGNPPAPTDREVS